MAVASLYAIHHMCLPQLAPLVQRGCLSLWNAIAFNPIRVPFFSLCNPSLAEYECLKTLPFLILPTRENANVLHCQDQDQNEPICQNLAKIPDYQSRKKNQVQIWRLHDLIRANAMERQMGETPSFGIDPMQVIILSTLITVSLLAASLLGPVFIF